MGIHIVSTAFILFYILVAPFSVYLGVVTLLAFRRKSPPLSGTTFRWLTVIPAHNEQEFVGRTVRSLLSSKPDGTIVVLADNCSDATANVAESAGAVVFERNDPHNPGKGQVLDWFFSTHATSLDEHDVVAIVDADSTVNETFYTGLEAALRHEGAGIAQAYYDVAPPLDGWRKKLTSIALRAFHHVRPAGRCSMGGSAGLRGNGMAFLTPLLRQYGWPAHSNVEDLEFSLMLARDGHAVAYAPAAKVFGDMPEKRTAATRQRIRWEGGRLAVARAWLPVLCKTWVRKPSRLTADAIADLATPPLSILVFSQLIVLVLGLATLPHNAGAIILALLPLLLSAFHVFAGLILTKASTALWSALVAVPFFLVWKISVYALILVTKHMGWDRTERDNSSSSNGNRG